MSFIFDKIKRSNSSLNRKPKQLLENSIERVVDVLNEDREDSEDLGPIDDEFDGVELSPKRRGDAMNRSVVGTWSKSVQRNGARGQSAEMVQETRIEQVKMKKRSSDGELPSTKRKKATASVDRSPPAGVSLADLGGVDPIIKELRLSIGRPMLYPSLYLTSGIKVPRGVLLYGPPGCGKTMIANAYAATLGVPFISLSAPSIVSGMSGESEKALREHFEEAKKIAPCLIFLDEIDAITPKRENVQREMEKRIVSQLLTCMDDLALEKTGGKPVMVVAATNRPDSLDPALRRGGRFDKEINMTMPTEQGREQILKALTQKLTISDDLDLKTLARMTPGFVGADLGDLVTKAGEAAISRFFDSFDRTAEMDGDDDPRLSEETKQAFRDVKLSKDSTDFACAVSIANDDFVSSLPRVQPMAKREGFATIPETTWADIGALQGARDELRQSIVDPIRFPERFARLGARAPSAALLWGPPGCGKTLLAKAVANEARANFISVQGPELLNKFVGESERAIRQVFERARATVPCVIFFDEIDALAPKRDGLLSESSARVVNTLLTELNGINKRDEIYVLGATNRPDSIDTALLRSGRLETLLFVGLPGKEERVQILQALTRKLNVEFDVIIADIARDCNGFSGADLEKLCRNAVHNAIQRGAESLEAVDFVSARRNLEPTVDDAHKYDGLKKKWGSNRGGVAPSAGTLTAHSAPSV